MRRAVQAAGCALGVLTLALACGDVPTGPLGVAYITPILAPSPTVAFGDTLRDSLGRAAPLRVFAIGKGDADTIRSVVVRYLFTSIDTGRGIGASIDRDGYLVADSVLRTLRVVAQVTDSAGGSTLRLQTNELGIEIVPRADSIARTTTADLVDSLPFAVPLSVTVRGAGPSGRATVAGIRVRYRIVGAFPAVPIDGRYFLADTDGNVLRPDSTIALDTTAAGGIATRSLIGLAAGGADPDSVIVQAEAASHRGEPLRGSPVRFTVKRRP